LIEMKLEPKTTALIAVGASTAANCAGCLEKTVSMAKEAGADEEEIGEAVDIGRRVQVGAAKKLDQVATTLNRTASSPAPAKSEGCALHRLIRRAQRTTSLDGHSGGD
jgi:AhpD family alkylhydroperoxidase